MSNITIYNFTNELNIHLNKIQYQYDITLTIFKDITNMINNNFSNNQKYNYLLNKLKIKCFNLTNIYSNLLNNLLNIINNIDEDNIIDKNINDFNNYIIQYTIHIVEFDKIKKTLSKLIDYSINNIIEYNTYSTSCSSICDGTCCNYIN